MTLQFFGNDAYLSGSVYFAFAGIVTLVKLEQPPNAEIPMVVTLSGIVTLVKLEQFKNA